MVEPLSDSTDWLPTPLAALASVESSLRCQVCKDFFNTPMITSCSHTFCSLCIRRYLSQEGRCPACRQSDQESKLRRNWVVEELVANFTATRKELLEFAAGAAAAAEDDGPKRPKKRRKVEDTQADGGEGRSTRSKSKRSAVPASQESMQTNDDDVIPDSDAGSEYEDGPEPSKHLSAAAPVSDDGLVACPICSRRMKEEAVYSHLNTCPGPGSANTKMRTSRMDGTTFSSPTSVAYSAPDSTAVEKRLPTLNYSMLNENALRKKLKELGISCTGPKLLMQKRHTEWVNLFNANSDSRRPRSKRGLLHDLEAWERTQGRQIANNVGPSGVMSKDFDGGGWARSNKDDFDDLIRKAREKRTKPTVTAAETKDPTSVIQSEATVINPHNSSLSGPHQQGTLTTTDGMHQRPHQQPDEVGDLPAPLKGATGELPHRSSQPQDVTT